MWTVDCHTQLCGQWTATHNYVDSGLPHTVIWTVDCHTQLEECERNLTEL
jgi:hypothetical protein